MVFWVFLNYILFNLISYLWYKVSTQYSLHHRLRDPRSFYNAQIAVSGTWSFSFAF